MTSLPRPTRRPRPRLVDRLPERDPEPERYNTASSIAALLAEPAQPVATPKPAPKAQSVDPYDTSIVGSDTIARWYRRIVWTGLAISFTFSVFGNLRPFGGDVTQLVTGMRPNLPYLSSPAFVAALGSAIVSQLVIQVFQFHAKARGWARRYWTFVALSVALSIWTFAPLLDAINDRTKIGLVWLYLGAVIVLAMNDYAQERALLRKRG